MSTTRSGTHVVMGKEARKLMSSDYFKYRDIPVTWAVQISANGEFVHENNGTISAQGNRNVSHGCANLSGPNAKIFYDLTMPGDPVEVVGSSIQLTLDLGDAPADALHTGAWTAKSAVTG